MGCHNHHDNSVNIVASEPTLTGAVIEILRAAIREKNGAVTDAMSDLGTHYALNYGVSVITLKDICKPYTMRSDRHALAAALWKQGVRELRLAALFIEDSALVTAQQAVEWSLSWESIEMAEQSAMRMLAPSPEALSIAKELFTDGHNSLQELAAHHIIARSCSRYSTCRVQHLLKFYGSQTTNRAAVIALREMWVHHPELRSAIDQISLNDELRSELTWQIEE